MKRNNLNIKGQSQSIKIAIKFNTCFWIKQSQKCIYIQNILRKTTEVSNINNKACNGKRNECNKINTN